MSRSAFRIQGIVLLLFSLGVGESQDLPSIKDSPVPESEKLSSGLRELAGAQGSDVRAKIAQRRHLSISNDMVEVEIDMLPGTHWDLAAFRSQYGVETVHVGIDDSRNITFVWARVPVRNLAGLAENHTEVRYVRPPALGVPLHTTQGVELTSAQVNFHQAGFRGAGVKIAVIDLGFAGWKGAQAEGELPERLVVKDFTGEGIEGRDGHREPHGTSVAEIVHDMAPEADLYLLRIASAIQLQEAVDYCAQEGIKVINHSVGWFNQSMYDGRGKISAIAAGARTNGILWINSAGNDARKHYQAVFSDIDGDGWHNFDRDDETINLQLERGARISVFLTWSAWSKLDGDYDLYLINDDLNVGSPIASSVSTRKTGDSTPTKMMEATIDETGRYHIAVRRISGARSHLLALFVSSENTPLELGEYQVPDHSLTDPAASESVLAVGAVSRSAWKSGPLESYSSQGPTNGGLIKPDICGPDQVDTSVSPTTYFLGIDLKDGFAGTSAAAPHVAGAAALLWSRFPESTATDIRVMLEANTRAFSSNLRDTSCGAGVLNLPSELARPSVKLASAVRIVEPEPYHPGQSVTAQFTIMITGTGCILLKALTLAGRLSDNTAMDFPWHNDVLLCAGDQYSYTAILKIPSVGNYHFSAAYKTVDGEWNTAPAISGPPNAIDISAVPSLNVLMGIGGNVGTDRTSLLRIDRRTGAAVVIGVTPLVDINDIAFKPDGALYGVTARQLLRINPLTGVAVVVGDLGYDQVNGLTSDSAGLLYAATFDGNLLSVDPVTGRASLIGNLGSGLRLSGDLAFAPNDTLYGTHRGILTDQLIRIDVKTGRAVVVGDIGFPNVYSLAFDENGILLAGAKGDTRSPQLIRINTTTGTGTLIGVISNANGLNGLSLGREPQSWSFFKDDMEGDVSAWGPQPPWSVTSEQSHSPTNAWSDSPFGNYGNAVNHSVWTPMVSLDTINGAVLRFWHRFDVENGYDYCQVWITTDFGRNYERLASYTGRSNNWIQSTIDLTRYVGAARAWLAFQIVSDSSTNGDGWYIDDVELIGAR